MYGYHDYPVKIAKEGFTLSVEQEGEAFVYRRNCLDSEETKTLLAGKGRVLINPVEPLNRPKAITPYLQISFREPVVLEPKATRRVFLTFPVEIGVFISVNRDFQVLDIFTLAKQSYTLYGAPNNGIICRYWKSAVHLGIPSVNPLQEGILELTLTNLDQEWVEAERTVLNAYGMKIYYNDEKVAMKAGMKVRLGTVAETDFEDAPLEPGMTNALEIYTVRKLLITSTKFLMEHGL